MIVKYNIFISNTKKGGYFVKYADKKINKYEIYNGKDGLLYVKVVPFMGNIKNEYYKFDNFNNFLNYFKSKGLFKESLLHKK